MQCGEKMIKKDMLKKEYKGIQAQAEAAYGMGAFGGVLLGAVTGRPEAAALGAGAGVLGGLLAKQVILHRDVIDRNMEKWHKAKDAYYEKLRKTFKEDVERLGIKKLGQVV